MRLSYLPSEFQKALPILEKIKAAGFEAYFVGGSEGRHLTLLISESRSNGKRSGKSDYHGCTSGWSTFGCMF